MSALLVACLITWRLTSLIVSEAGPFDLFARIRDQLGVYYDEASQCQGRWSLARGLCCVWCTSVWVGWAVAYGFRLDPWPLTGLALSAGTIMIDRWMNA